MPINWPAILVIGALTALTVSAVPGAAGAQGYQGEAVTVLNGYSPGGGSDTLTRTFTRHWKNHLEGASTMVVKNMPGAGGSKALNFIYEKASKNGDTVLLSPWNPVGWVLGTAGSRSDYGRMAFIGGGSVAKIAYLRAIVGINKPSQIRQLMPLKLAGSRPTSNFDILNRAALQLLGVEYQYVRGYRAGPQRLKALQQAEADMDTASLSFFTTRVKPTMIDRGRAIPLWYYPAVQADGTVARIGDVEAMGVLSYVDLYKEMNDGRAPSGPAWEVIKWVQLVTGNLLVAAFAPPGTDPAKLAELRASFEAATKDPAYIADARKSATMSFVTLKEGQAIIDGLATTSPETIANLRKVIASRQNTR